MLIDTHAHVNFSAFREDAEAVIERALTQSIFFINVGSQYSTSRRAVLYAQKYPGKMWATVGTHPLHLVKGSFSHKDDEELSAEEIRTIGEDVDFVKYGELAKNSEVVAIGEVGLDYHHFEPGDDVEKIKAKQQEILKGFINLANEVKKPVAIHCWDAYADLYEILKNNPVEKRGVIHSFVGSYKTAKKFIDLGYWIGINGVVTYSESFDKLIKETPLEKIVLETDCPYLTPVPFKGERNEPAFVKYVAEKVAKIKEISVAEVSTQTTANAKQLFKFDFF
jgi:TatD DNase family protein